jgi:drug/metabolite transporter (DMT)-like permease
VVTKTDQAGRTPIPAEEKACEPAMAALIGLVVLQVSLHWSQWIAVLCVVAASAGATRGSRPAGLSGLVP